MAKGPGLFGSLFGRKKNKKNKDVVAAPLPAPDYPKDPTPTRDIRIEPKEHHYDLPDEPIVEKKGERKSSDSNGVTTIEIPPIQIDEEVFIEVERKSGDREKNGKKEEKKKESEPSSRESRKRAPAPPPPLSPELQEQLNTKEVKYQIKKPAEPLSPSSQTSDQLRDLASSGAPTPQPTREQPVPRGIVVEVHPNHPAVRPREEELPLTTVEYTRKEERIRERVEEFPRFAPPPPSVSPMPKLPAMRVTVDRRPPSPPPPQPQSPVTRVVESRREYSRDTVVTENRSRTVVRTKEVVRENAPPLSDEERMLQKKYDHLKAKFDRWQYLKSTDKENPETKKLQAELMVEHDRVVALLSSLYPSDSGASSASSQRSSPQAPRNGHSNGHQLRSPSAHKETEKRVEAPRLEEKTERKKREAPAPNPSSPTPSSSGLSSYSASSSLSSPNSGSKYTRDLNDNLIRRPPKEETTERRKKSSTAVDPRDERSHKTNGTSSSSRPKSLLIPAPDYDTTPSVDYRTTSTLNQSEFFGPSIPYYDNRARTISDPKQARRESTSSYGSSTLSRRDQPRTQLEWEMAAQVRAEEELKRSRERQQHIRDASTPSSQRSSDSSSYKTMSSGKSNNQSESRTVVQDAGRLSLDSTKQAKRISRESPEVVYGERSFTLPKKSSLPAPPPLSSERERQQEKAPRLQAREEPRVQQSIARPSALPPTPPVPVVVRTTTHEVIRPTPIKASPAPPPPTPSTPAQSIARDVPVKLVGPSQPQQRPVATLPVKRVEESGVKNGQRAQPMMMAKEEFSTATLKKVGPPREQSAVALGRVIDTPTKTPSSSIPPAPPLPPVLPSVSSPSSSGPPAPPPPPPSTTVASPRTPITAEALRGVQLKPAKERPVQQTSAPTTPLTQADVKDQLMAAIRGGVQLRKVSSPAKVQ